MKVKFFPFFLSLIFLLIFIVFYKGLNKSNIYAPDNIIEKKVPSFSGKLFNQEKEVTSSEIFAEKKFYLVNIWASWCIPCREEHSFLMELNRIENLEIIGINYKDKTDNAKSFLNELKNPYDLIILDKSGTISIEWGAYGVPETFLISDKNIMKKIIGPLNTDSFSKIKDLVK